MENQIPGQLCIAEAAVIIEESREQQYKAFVDKFKDAKTTDDCYTPPEIYDVIADWVAAEYGIGRERFLRPFRPGGDYQAEEYPDGCAVVDNPPFSILAQIVDWYLARGVPFFLFGPTLTLLGLMKRPERKTKICILLIGAPITYENGAEVNTSFVTSMDEYAVRIEAELRASIAETNDRLQKEKTKELPKYVYPDYILCGKDYRLAKYAQTLRIRHQDCAAISAMDAQRPSGKSIFGGGLLLSERAAAERAAAERAAATKWQLSEREWRIIQKMESGGGALNVRNNPSKTQSDQRTPKQISFTETE